MTTSDNQCGEIKTEIVLSEEGWKRLRDLIENPPEPTEALRRLMRGYTHTTVSRKRFRAAAYAWLSRDCPTQRA